MLADERLLVDEQDRDQRDSDEVDGAEIRDRREAAETDDGKDVHEPRHEQRIADAKANGDRLQPGGPIEVEILAGIENVEAADPRTNRRAEEPRLARGNPSTRGEPAADRRDSHREGQEQLGVGREPLGQGIPEHDRQRDRRQQETDAPELVGGADEGHRRDGDEHARFSAGHRAARNLAHRRPWVPGVVVRVDQPVEPHRGAARRHHGDDDPEHAPRHIAPGQGPLVDRQERSGQGERKGKHAVTEADER